MNEQTTNYELDDLIIFVEKIFFVRIPDDIARDFDDAGRMQDWLEHNISNQSPQQHAIALLRRLAQAQQRPSLAEGVNKQWRKEQISAIVGDLFCKREMAN